MTEDTQKTKSLPTLTLQLHWHLDALLEKYGIKRLQLEKHAGVSVNTILELCRRTDLGRFNISNAERLLNSLRQMTGQDLKLSELVTISTSIEGNIVSVLQDGTPPAPDAPLFEEAKPAKPARKDTPKGPALKSVPELLEAAAAQGVTVYLFPGTGANQGHTIGVACENKNQLAKLTGIGKSTIYSPKLQENPADAQTLTDLLSKPRTVFMKRAGEERFSEVTG